MTKTIITAAGFNGLDSRWIRFIHEISKSGQLDVLLFSDALIQSITHIEPKYAEPERRYFLVLQRHFSSRFSGS